LICLGLDTALAACSAALIRDRVVLATASEAMMRGQQEHLGPMVRDLLAEAGLSPSDVGRVGVTIGPGSFTGVRVGLAFAKGFAFARDIPCVGVGTLEALAGSVDQAGLCAAVIDAKLGQVYFQVFESGAALMAPDRLSVETAAARLVELRGERPAVLAGSGAALLAKVWPDARIAASETPDPATVARLAAVLAHPPPPRPLYLRAPYANMEPA
jgi:tRNA threonylcarbamoyladenosine biosynthesis protein TsaB